jgi:integrase/recombinase XerD
MMNDDPTQAVSPLRQRMIEDMTMRRLSPKTQMHYIGAVKRLAQFLGRSPDSVNGEELRRFQLHLVQIGMSPISINSTIVGIRFFLEATLERPELMNKMRPVRVEQRLPVILSRDEVARLIDAAQNPKGRTILSVAYGTGLRAGEIVALKSTDVDSERMTLRVQQGKGHKDRYAVLPPLLLERLRQWWRLAKPMGLVRDGGWLFPSRNPIEPLCPRQLNRVIHEAARNAGIEKRVSMHTLRHCFATHLLEQKEDIRVIQMLLGHKKLNTTAHYTQVAAEVLQQVVSPIESQRTPPPTQ